MQAAVSATRPSLAPAPQHPRAERKRGRSTGPRAPVARVRARPALAPRAVASTRGQPMLALDEGALARSGSGARARGGPPVLGVSSCHIC
eukprot:3584632-Alexandrium_andersonii.AAC.1